MFDINGGFNFLYTFGNKGEGDGAFNTRYCLLVDEVEHLMVCDPSNHRVHLLELSGKFVTKFGSKGKSEREFNLLISTAVLSDGRIAVSDFCNHRIHIFEKIDIAVT